jgi:predicted metal-dependent phosphoesterase TrpH
VDGIPLALEAAQNFPSLTVIPGVEINTEVAAGEAHILGYFIDYHHPELLASLVNLRNSRLDRAQRMITKLSNLGLDITWERVKEIAGDGSIGRPHIAQALQEKGYINSFQEAFNKYIGWGGPAYVAREKIAPAEATQLILRASGLPVLAHPLTLTNPEAMIAELKTNGLAGIEGYYKGYTPEEIKGLVRLADKYSLIVTGGTDYHGLGTSDETTIGGVEVPLKSAEQLLALAKKKMLRPTSP